jgi:hypothetical protein
VSDLPILMKTVFKAVRLDLRTGRTLLIGKVMALAGLEMFAEPPSSDYVGTVNVWSEPLLVILCRNFPVASANCAIPKAPCR